MNSCLLCYLSVNPLKLFPLTLKTKSGFKTFHRMIFIWFKPTNGKF
jgi:hypothetical protein